MTLEDKINQIVKPICEANDLYLVGVKAKGNPANPVLQIFADSEMGITLGQCEQLSRLIQDELDTDDSIYGNYRLEVSSPGLDRALVHDFEFKKNLGKTLSVKMKTAQGDKTLTGKLVEFDEKIIKIESGEEVITIRREEINKAKVKVQW